MKLEYCSDMIGLYKGQIVMIERLSYPQGYALPGGRRDPVDGGLESVEACAVREFKEETGLDFVVDGELGIYDDPSRDPRGPKISTAVYGTVVGGEFRDEPGKTRVFLMDPADLQEYKDKFVFDHYQVISDWIERKSYK
jgi:8-oxo-dGTP diphosphatase